MVERNIVEVKEVPSVELVNQWLDKGWVLLAVGSGTENDDGNKAVTFRYSIGRPDSI